MDTTGLTKVVLNEKERRIQYTTIKEWIERNKQDLLEQGIRADETHESGVALIAGNNSRQSNQRQGGLSGKHSHSPRGGSSVNQSANNYHNRNNQTASQNNKREDKLSPCGYCNIISENRSLPYTHLNFEDTHRNVRPGRTPFPTQCLQWLLLKVDERAEMIKNTTHFFCHTCLKIRDRPIIGIIGIGID